jgi:hypothetical protein
LAAYLACHCPTTLVYFDMEEHFNEIDQVRRMFGWEWHRKTKFVSYFEIFHAVQDALNVRRQGRSEYFAQIEEKLAHTKVTVVDQYSRVKYEVYEALMKCTRGKLLLLD